MHYKLQIPEVFAYDSIDLPINQSISRAMVRKAKDSEEIVKAVVKKFQKFLFERHPNSKQKGTFLFKSCINKISSMNWKQFESIFRTTKVVDGNQKCYFSSEQKKQFLILLSSCDIEHIYIETLRINPSVAMTGRFNLRNIANSLLQKLCKKIISQLQQKDHLSILQDYEQELQKLDEEQNYDSNNKSETHAQKNTNKAVTQKNLSQFYFRSQMMKYYNFRDRTLLSRLIELADTVTIEKKSREDRSTLMRTTRNRVAAAKISAIADIFNQIRDLRSDFKSNKDQNHANLLKEEKLAVDETAADEKIKEQYNYYNQFVALQLENPSSGTDCSSYVKATERDFEEVRIQRSERGRR